ncbi:MAG: hypothetical protein PHW73_00540 [Atribacterota bacterium]|nr:hypothetical protein [Atribacterota bacterium]
MSKIIELAKKLKALSDRGEGGEKFNAATKLKQLMDKYDLTLEDIEDSTVLLREFDYKRGQEQILIQSIRSVVGKKPKILSYRKGYGKQTTFIVECTQYQFIEIKAVFNFFWPKYQADLHTFNLAFIYKNDLLSPDSEKDSEPPTDEEFDKIQKVIKMMDVLDKNHYKKQLK